MSVSRIDIVVPGAEGGWIARALRQAGFDVREADDAKGSEDADAVVLDRTVDGFHDAIAALKSPLRIVVGWDPPDPEDLEEWKAHATFTRPVPIPKLVEALAGELGAPPAPPPAPPRAPLRATIPAPPSSTPPPAEIVTREPTMNLDADALPPPREPTMALGGDEVPTLDEIPIPEDSVAEVSQIIDRRSSRPPPPSSSEVISSTGVTAEFSPTIAGLLREADRRIFPNEPSLDLRFPGGDEPAELLVPDELLAEVSMPLDLPDADPLDAFTFVGTPDLIDTSARGNGPARREGTGKTGHTPHTVEERLPRPAESAAASTSVRSDVGREGMLPSAGAIRVLWQAHDEPRPVETRFDVAGGPSITVATHQGRLIAFEGPVHLRVADMLRAEGRIRTVPDDEASAQTLLEDEVRFGRMHAFELSQLLRRARETLIHELILASEARFAMRAHSGPTASRPLVHGLLIAVACEGARRRVGPRDALRWLGIEPHGKLVLSSTFAQRASDAGLEPELIEAFERAAEGAVGELLGDAPALAGVPGILLTLASADAVRVDGEAESMEIQAAVARERVLRAADRAREGSYFVVLGVSRDASGREVETARRRLTRELSGIDLAFLGLDNLEDVRREALVAIEEAAEILASDRLRQAYAQALDRAPLR